ncbi:MAG: tRNA lysidine(34) synthetase TilS [Burkholderiales bacterium]|nr:tRNA lysidine(34) synthetase TilS [Burkholderiales bacterium]
MASSRKRPSAEGSPASFEAAVAERIARCVGPGARLTLALSGGIDSIVLLETLRRLARRDGLRLDALHVNHGLSANALAWERFCAAYCRRRGIAFRAVRVELAGAGNVEARARAARYAAFAQWGSELVALAHNRDDQAETALLNLLRGSGVRGLAAMPLSRMLDPSPGRRAQRLIRPLIDVPRSAIAAYARARKLRWIEDESNSEQRFSRNFLRLKVLPLLQRRFPECGANIARAAAHIAQAVETLDALAAADCAAVTAGERVDAKRLMALGEARAANALRYFLARRGEAPPSTLRTREILRQLGTARRDAQPELRLERGTLRRHRGWIEFVRDATPAEATPCRVWRGERRLAFGAGELRAVRARGGGVSMARLRAAEVTVRVRRGGERMRLDPQGPRRTLKNLLQEADVPAWERAGLPLVFCGAELAWVPHVGVAAEFRARGAEAALRFAWRGPAESID